MNEGDFAAACPKLEESQRLDPGGGTLMNLALCHEKLGRTATAWAEFKESYSLGVRDGREARIKLARAHIADLEPRLSRVKLEPTTPTTPGLKIFVDEVLVGSPTWGFPTPMDPGTHVVRATAMGYLDWTENVVLGVNDASISVRIPALDKVPVLVELPPRRGENATPTRKLVGVSLMGVGLAGLGIGTGFGILAISKRGESDKFCSGASGCVPGSAGVRLNDSAITYSWVSTAAFAGALVAGGVGAYLALTSRVPTMASTPRRATAMSAMILPVIDRTSRGAVVQTSW